MRRQRSDDDDNSTFKQQQGEHPPQEGASRTSVLRVVGAGGEAVLQEPKSALRGLTGGNSGSFAVPAGFAAADGGGGGGGTAATSTTNVAASSPSPALLSRAGSTATSSSSSVSLTAIARNAALAGQHVPEAQRFPTPSPMPLDPTSAISPLTSNIPHSRPAVIVWWISRQGTRVESKPFYPCCGLFGDTRRGCTASNMYHPGTIVQGRQTRTSARKSSSFAHWSCCTRPLVSTHGGGPTGGSGQGSYQVTGEHANGCTPRPSVVVSGGGGTTASLTPWVGLSEEATSSRS